MKIRPLFVPVFGSMGEADSRGQVNLLRFRVYHRAWVCMAMGLAAGLSCSVGRAERDQEPSSGTVAQWIKFASRYGTFGEKRKAKQEAKTKLFSYEEEGLRWLMEHVHIERIGIRILAQELMGKLDASQAVPILLPFLEHSEPFTRKFAVYFLGFYEQPVYIPRLIPLLLDPVTKGSALRTLGKWGDPCVAPYVIGHLQHEDERIRILAANALGDLRAASAIPGLMACLNDRVFTVRTTAQRALQSLGDEAGKALLKSLAEFDGTALRHAVRALGKLRIREAIPELKRLMSHPSWGVRGDAARAFMYVDSDQAVTWLSANLKEETDPYVLLSLDSLYP